MSERAFNRLLAKLDREEQALFQEAIDRLHASRGLRLLVWRFFEECGMAQSPFSSDPLTTARNAGKLEAAHALRDLITAFDPDLVPSLQLEMTRYDRSRTDQLDDRLNNDTAD